MAVVQFSQRPRISERTLVIAKRQLGHCHSTPASAVPYSQYNRKSPRVQQIRRRMNLRSEKCGGPVAPRLAIVFHSHPASRFFGNLEETRLERVAADFQGTHGSIDN